LDFKLYIKYINILYIMYSYLFGKYFYLTEIEEIIDQIATDRQKLRDIGEKLNTTFAEELKLKLNGKTVISAFYDANK